MQSCDVMVYYPKWGASFVGGWGAPWQQDTAYVIIDNTLPRTSTILHISSTSFLSVCVSSGSQLILPKRHGGH